MGRNKKQLYEPRSIKEGKPSPVCISAEYFLKLQRYEKALKVIAENTTCDDTWDFTSRILEGKEMTGLPYRFNLD
jgi:hypothetical protein